MKYIDADKLIANLRRQKRTLELSIQSQGDYGQSCQIVAYENILSIIDSLQQEQSVEGLEEELMRYISSDEYINTRGNGTLLIARHFAEWGRKQVLQEIYEGKTKPVDKITAAWLDDE